MPAYARTRTTAAGQRSFGVWSSSRMRTPPKTIWLALRNGTSLARSKVLPAEVEVHPADHDLQVFRDLRLLLLGGGGLQLGDDRFGLLALRVFIGQRGLRNLGVVLRQSLLRAELGMVLERDLDQHVGVAVADRDPVGLRFRLLGTAIWAQMNSGRTWCMQVAQQE